MGRWVTLADDQHVYISDGSKVLATRSAISSAGGAKQRGKALAARSKTAIGKALAKQRIAIATGIGEWNKPGAETERSRLKSEISQHLARREHTQAAQKSKRLTELEKKEGQSPPTTRAIEHAKTAGPGQAREMARSQFKVAEKIRTGKMADAALKARYAREDALKAKLNAPKPAATPVRPKISEPPRSKRDAKGNIYIPDKQLAKAVHTGTDKNGMAAFSWDKPSTTGAIEHARAAKKGTRRVRG